MVFNNLTKNFAHDLEGVKNTQRFIDMAAIIQGGYDKLRERPIVAMGACPNSPLEINENETSIIILVGQTRSADRHSVHGTVRRDHAGDAGRHSGLHQRGDPGRHRTGSDRKSGQPDPVRLFHHHHGYEDSAVTGLARLSTPCVRRL